MTIDLAPLSERTGPGAEAAWRDDIRKAALAGGAPEDLAAAIAAAAEAPTGGPAWLGGVQHGLYSGWSRLLCSGEAGRASCWPLLDGLAERWPDFAGLAARWTDHSGVTLISRAEDRR